MSLTVFFYFALLAFLSTSHIHNIHTPEPPFPFPFPLLSFICASHAPLLVLAGFLLLALRLIHIDK